MPGVRNLTPRFDRKRTMANDAYDADLIVIGSGVMGGIIASSLAKAGKKVIVLEAGPRLDRRDIVETFRNAPVKLSLANAKLQGRWVAFSEPAARTIHLW
nr:FAD-dependent oxidoreductase [Ochrobactrum sp. Marseille-Q0166]